MPEDRRLAAIMFTDIVGYTALMGSDEDKAFQLLRKNRDLQRPLIKKYRGEWLKEMGDGILASFFSASDAVKCAGEIQNAAKKAGVLLRIGIHEGEVVFEGGDVLGDGVNVASRLEELAEEGCIYISGAVYKDIRNKADIETEFIEKKVLKNVDYPVKVYRVQYQESESEHVAEDVLQKSISRLPYYLIIGIVVVLVAVVVWKFVPTKENAQNLQETATIEMDRSIAVLPFANLSNDPGQEYFIDGMMDEILTHLFKIGDLDVTSRTSVMQYKGTTKTIPQIAKELGVIHVLEGSILKDKDRIRITVQLIEAEIDNHIWAESYNREIKDIFSIQSEVAQQVAVALKAEISPEVKERIESFPTESSEAYDLLLQAKSQFMLSTEEGLKNAGILIDEVIQLDPNYSYAYCIKGLLKQAGAGWQTRDGGMDPREAAKLGKPFYKKALEVDNNNSWAHLYLAWSYLWYEWDFENAEKEYKMVVKLQPNYSWSDYLIALGRFEEAYQGALKTLELNPLSSSSWSGKILSSYFSNRPDVALNTIEIALNSDIRDPSVFNASNRAHLYLGMFEEVINTCKIFFLEYPQLKVPRPLAHLGIAYYHTNHIETTNDILLDLKERSNINAGGSPSFHIAMIYAQMGETDLAFEWLDKAYETYEVEMYWLKIEPPFEPLHDDPRWQVILDKVGIPD